MKHRWRGQSGFTIVELLIVIVVIGILAGLVLNTYSGIQAKARDTQIRAAADTITKALVIWNADTGQNPGTSGGGSGSSAKNADGSCVGGNGQGWFQQDTPPNGYICSIEDVLVAGKYLSSNTLTNLPINKKQASFGSKRIFMLYSCNSKTPGAWGLYYALESPTERDKADIASSNTVCRDLSNLSSAYGMEGFRLIQL